MISSLSYSQQSGDTGTYFVVLLLPLVEVLLQCLLVAVLKVLDSVVNDLGLVVFGKDPLDRHVALVCLVVALPILRGLIFRLSEAVRAFYVEFEGQDVLSILVDFVPGGVEVEVVDQFLDESLISGREVVDNGALIVGIGGRLMIGDKLLYLVERLLLVLCDDCLSAESSRQALTQLATLSGLFHRLNLLLLLALVPMMVGKLGFKVFNLELGELVQHELQPVQGDCAVLVEVSAGFWEDSFVDRPDPLQCTLVDVKIGQVGQEIVTDKDAHEDEIIYDPFKIVLEWQFQSERGEFQI